MSFLENRKARIKVNNTSGDWLDSELGTSAGTIWGPLLFLIFVSDIPKSLKPKFADDVMTVAVADSIQEIQVVLQNAINELQ